MTKMPVTSITFQPLHITAELIEMVQYHTNLMSSEHHPGHCTLSFFCTFKIGIALTVLLQHFA